MKIFSENLLANQVGIVTGGGTGIGKQIAKTLGESGAKIVIAGRRQAVLEETTNEFVKEGIEARAISIDIRVPEQVQQLVDFTVESFGKVDILVNNAGGQFPKKSEELTPNGWNAVIHNNLNGTFYVTQAVAKQMIKQGAGGAITNILVSFLHRGAPGIAHSVAARNGVYGMMRTLALEWAKYNIRINSIGPGLFVTEGMKEEMASSAGPHFIEQVTQDVPLGRTGRLQELGWLVTYLSCPAAEYMTGEFIVIDGGNSLGRGLTFVPY
ncbi:SDR family oxidoreductase [Brevibacillus nitrificans]|uniref:SDR family oxidoreductase n=1 Tax=Brevibacillus nitrificans TaxID=651560 RepID=UPI00285E54AB|nr:SDR family oxidoreductase [Brevibacillus nitrificans]MDR7317614.1 NAD(P)-dependent dehydrogenase (short-subunit alcohol dehydrogenase family) [Brevibacillus nitrificans]